MESVSCTPLSLLMLPQRGIDNLAPPAEEFSPPLVVSFKMATMTPHMLEKLAPLVEDLVVTAVDYSRVRRRSSPTRRPGVRRPHLPPMTSATP